MSKFTRYEGGWDSRMRQMMARAGAKSEGLRIELATVIEAPPNLKIMRDSDQMILEKEELVVAEHLTRHERIVSINYEFPKTWEKDTDIGDKTVDTVSSRNNIGQLPSTPYEKYEMKYATLKYEDLLLKGERVLVACDDVNMVYYIIDRARWYERDHIE